MNVDIDFPPAYDPVNLGPKGCMWMTCQAGDHLPVLLDQESVFRFHPALHSDVPSQTFSI